MTTPEPKAACQSGDDSGRSSHYPVTADTEPKLPVQNLDTQGASVEESYPVTGDKPPHTPDNTRSTTDYRECPHDELLPSFGGPVCANCNALLQSPRGRTGGTTVSEPWSKHNPPSCPHGYTQGDLERYLGDRLPAFWKWFDGQTGSICDGRLYNHESREYEPTACADNPHGLVCYPYDVDRFIEGKCDAEWVGVFDG